MEVRAALNDKIEIELDEEDRESLDFFLHWLEEDRVPVPFVIAAFLGELQKKYNQACKELF
jgi:hypothetical protein